MACHDVSTTSFDSVTEKPPLLLSQEDFHFHSLSHSLCICVPLRARPYLTDHSPLETQLRPQLVHDAFLHPLLCLHNFLPHPGPIPKHLNPAPTTYDHYRFFQQYHSSLPIPYGFYRPESAFSSYGLRLPPVAGISRDQSSHLLEEAALGYQA